MFTTTEIQQRRTFELSAELLEMFSNLGGNRLCRVLSTNIIAIRGKRVWARNALGSPVAESKLFRVPQKPPVARR